MKVKSAISSFLTTGLLFTFLAGCGKQDDAALPGGFDRGQVQGETPGSLPPPAFQAKRVPESRFDADIANQFFQKKEVSSRFSEKLKQHIARSYDEVSLQEATGQKAEYLLSVGKIFPIPADGSACDPVMNFLCVDEPRPDSGNEVFTEETSLDVQGRLDISQWYYSAPEDPVVTVAVKNLDEGGAPKETYLSLEQLQNEGNIASFSQNVSLGAYGTYQVIVASVKQIGEGDDVSSEPVSKELLIYRTPAAEIGFVEARPVLEGQVGEPVNDGAKTQAQGLQLTVRLLSDFSKAVQVQFYNYDAQGKPMAVTSAGFKSSNMPEGNPQDGYLFKAELPLHRGLNDIRMVGLPSKKGEMPQALSFKVYNSGYGAAKFKLLTPVEQVEQTSVDQSVEIQFCYVNSEAPDDCLVGDLGFEVLASRNGHALSDRSDRDGIRKDGGSGIYTARLMPNYGLNNLEIVAKVKGSEAVLSQDLVSFGLGRRTTFLENGVIADGKDLFVSSALNLEINHSFLTGEVKDTVQRFLDRPETRDMVMNMFKVEMNEVPNAYSCSEYKVGGKDADSDGKTTIEFDPTTFCLGQKNAEGICDSTSVKPLVLETLEPSKDGTLHVTLTLNGLYGDAEMRRTDAAKPTDEDTFDLAFIPVTFAIKKATLKVAVAFRPDIDADEKPGKESLNIDIRKIDGVEPLQDLVGAGPADKLAYINCSKNPLACGAEAQDWQLDLVGATVRRSIGGALLCGVEDKFRESGTDQPECKSAVALPNPGTGMFCKAAVDLPKLTGYDEKNFMRLPLDFDFFGKKIQLDIAYDILKSAIQFSPQGLSVRGVPVRLNPGPKTLEEYQKQAAENMGNLSNGGTPSTVASLSRLEPLGDAASDITDENRQLGASLSEDVINQALFAANFAGLLNLDVDANFYAKNELTPSSQLLPQGSMLLMNKIDVNFNGSADDDAEVPVLLRLRTNPNLPPMLTFLGQNEVEALANREAELVADAASRHFDAKGKYFQLQVAGLEISTYQAESNASAGFKTYCNTLLPQSQSDEFKAQGFCPVAADAKTMVELDKLPPGVTCADTDLVNVPQGNGAIVSRPSPQGGEVPIFRVRVGLTLHGEIQPVHREVPTKDLLFNSEAEKKNILRLKLVPKVNDAEFREAFFVTVEVLENRSGQPDDLIISNVQSLVNAAFGDNCQIFNEVRLALPSSFPEKLEEGGLLDDLGIESIGIGLENNLPQANIDDGRGFLEALIGIQIQHQK